MTWRELLDRNMEPILVLLALVAVCATIVGVVVSDNHYRTRMEARIAEAVAAGVHPVAARCAIYSISAQPCLLLAAQPQGRAP